MRAASERISRPATPKRSPRKTPQRASLYARLKLAGSGRSAVAFRRFRRSLDRAGPRPRPSHHAGNDRVFRGDRRAYDLARGARPRHRHGLGVDPRSRRRSPQSSTCPRSGNSSAISVSVIRRPTTPSPNSSRPDGSSGGCRRRSSSGAEPGQLLNPPANSSLMCQNRAHRAGTALLILRRRLRMFRNDKPSSRTTAQTGETERRPIASDRRALRERAVLTFSCVGVALASRYAPRVGAAATCRSWHWRRFGARPMPTA